MQQKSEALTSPKSSPSPSMGTSLCHDEADVTLAGTAKPCALGADDEVGWKEKGGDGVEYGLTGDARLFEAINGHTTQLSEL
jgi:hypothetical protein